MCTSQRSAVSCFQEADIDFKSDGCAVQDDLIQFAEWIDQNFPAVASLGA